MAEHIQIVDKNDDPLGTATRQEALAQGLYHRLVQIVLRDNQGNFLLQKRSSQKSLYPNRWTNAASGHVDAGETYETTALRELAEEIGIITALHFVGKFPVQQTLDDKIMNQFFAVFEGTIPRDAKLTLKPNEVSTTKWCTPAELRERITSTPDEFTPAMVRTIVQFY